MKRKIIFLYISLLMLPLLGCTSVNESGERKPNSDHKKDITEGVDIVETPFGRLYIEWINEENLGRELSHVPVYEAVKVKVYVLCKGSSQKVLKLERSVCSYDGYEQASPKSERVGLGFSEQLKSVASVTASNQLKVNPKNDRLCNSALIQDLSVKVMCQ